MWNFFRRRRRRHLIASAMPGAWRQWLQETVPAYGRLGDERRERLDATVKILVAERTFEGCDGLQVTEPMRVAIAGHMAVMLLGSGDYYFDSVTSILVYPRIIERTRDGVVTQLVGEAWESGSVILAWSSVKSLRHERGSNIVVHEFAHHLDGRDGEMGGSIPFHDRETQQEWERVATKEHEELVEAVESRLPSLLDPYGATNRAEFFAVASETFFERPHALENDHRELFGLLKKFYRVDPREWQPESH